MRNGRSARNIGCPPPPHPSTTPVSGYDDGDDESSGVYNQPARARRNGNFQSGESGASNSDCPSAADSFKSTATHGSGDATDVRRAERVFSSSAPSPSFYPKTAALGPEGLA